MTYLMTDLIFFDISDTDSLSTQLFISSMKWADKSSINLLWLLDKQIALYSQDDMMKTDLFQKWWNLTLYETKLLSLRKNIKWERKAAHKRSAWSHFIKKVNVMQEESRIICILC